MTRITTQAALRARTMIRPGAGGFDWDQAQAEHETSRRNLSRLETMLMSFTEAGHRGDVSDPNLCEDTPDERLGLLAALSPLLRSPMQVIIGGIEMFLAKGRLEPEQIERLRLMLAASRLLLERVHDVANLSNLGIVPGACRIEAESGLEEAMPGQPGSDVQASPGEAAPPAMIVAPTARLRVLVVDDDVAIGEITAGLLDVEGHDAVVARSGEAALAALRETPFDLVLMDVRMPGMDGLETTRRIRAMPDHDSLPILAMTSLAFPGDIEDCRAAGMNGHLAKPFRQDALAEAVQRAALSFPPVGTAPQVRPTPPGLRDTEDAPQDGVRAAQPSKPWLHLVNSWNVAPIATTRLDPDEYQAANGQDRFTLIIASAPTASSERTPCAPPAQHFLRDFHWLVYVKPKTDYPERFHAPCDLWRWNGSAWFSVTVPSTHFTPVEMAQNGWIYGRPCVDKMAMVELRPDQGHRLSA